MTIKLIILGIASFFTYLCTYFLNLSMANFEQYLAVVAVLWLDGVFGVWAGCKSNKKYICVVNYINRNINGRKRIFRNSLVV